MWAANVVFMENQAKKTGIMEKALDERMDSVKERIVEIDSVKDVIKMRGEVAKKRLDFATADVQIQKSLAGLNKRGTSIKDALGNLEAKADRQEAVSQALDEMRKQGIITSVTTEIVGPVDDAKADEVMKQIEEDMKKLKETKPTIEESLERIEIPIEVPTSLEERKKKRRQAGQTEEST
jgi:hypothetical protein